MNNEERWKQRFQNLNNAYAVFKRRLDGYLNERDDEAEQMALVQAFEIVQELSWKTLKDYLENKGYDDVKNSKQTIRRAFQDEMIQDAEIWMQSIEIRNETSHTYNHETMKKVLAFIVDKYSRSLQTVYSRLKAEL